MTRGEIPDTLRLRLYLATAGPLSDLSQRRPMRERWPELTMTACRQAFRGARPGVVSLWLQQAADELWRTYTGVEFRMYPTELGGEWIDEI